MSESNKKKKTRSVRFKNLIANIPRLNRSLAKGKNPAIRRSETLDSTVVHKDKNEDTTVASAGEGSLSEKDNLKHRSYLTRVKKNYEILAKESKTRSVNSFVNQKKYMDEKMTGSTTQLRKVLRRSVQRARYSRSLRKGVEVNPDRFKNTFGIETVFNSAEEPETVSNNAVLAVEMKSRIQQIEKEKAARADELLVEGNLEQLKISGIGKTWKGRYGVLKAEGLAYFDSKHDFQVKAKPVGLLLFGDLITTREGKIAEIMPPTKAFRKLEKSFIFILRTEKERFHFSVRTNRGLGKWIAQMDKAFTGYLYHKGKETAIRESLENNWVPPEQWAELTRALGNPDKALVNEVKQTMKVSLLEYLDNHFINRMNLERKQLAFLAWKAYLGMIKKEQRNEQLYMIGRRHSLVNFQIENKDQMKTNNKRVSFKRIPKDPSNRRLKQKQKSRGFILSDGKTKVEV